MGNLVRCTYADQEPWLARQIELSRGRGPLVAGGAMRETAMRQPLHMALQFS